MSTDPPNRFVRQFAMVKGRTQAATGPLPLDSLITAVPGRSTSGLPPEQLDLLDRCGSPLSIAEIAAHLGVHLGIARVLVGDLLQAGLATVCEGLDDDSGPDLSTLEKVYHDLRNL